MERISIFDMFKIGIGPSSSHTMGPWRAAQRFLDELDDHQLANIKSLQVHLFGSLAKTGQGHGTDIAVQLGLIGADPETFDVSSLEGTIEQIKNSSRLSLRGGTQIEFNPETDIIFHRDKQLPKHPNALTFKANVNGKDQEATYYSVGGGFVVAENESPQTISHQLPYPIDTGADLLSHCEANSMSIAEVVMANEQTWRPPKEIVEKITDLKNTMLQCIHRGCTTEGTLPGGLNVVRRAPKIAGKLFGSPCPKTLDEFLYRMEAQPGRFDSVVDWVTCFALAVNEENAAFGRVVTAPTNGAAGVIPAVLLYCMIFKDVDEGAFIDFLLVAGEIGSIFKKGATISAAMGGCQAEIGVSSAMAAAALTECLGGTPAQAAEAAEIAMEHHLGMTCDPIGGLVQIPCIERNAMGAMKAITASQMALHRDPVNARVSLDAVVRTMWQTANDMSQKYKETSEAGLATQITVSLPEC